LPNKVKQVIKVTATSGVFGVFVNSYTVDAGLEVADLAIARPAPGQ